MGSGSCRAEHVAEARCCQMTVSLVVLWSSENKRGWRQGAALTAGGKLPGCQARRSAEAAGGTALLAPVLHMPWS